MRSLRIIIVCTVVIVVLLIWKAGIGWQTAPAQSRLEESIHSAISSPKEFVKSHVTGGVGVALMMDSASGLPKVGSVLPGSPAESAGLRSGDTVIKVGDWETAGQPLSNVVETLRGFAGAKVNITVRRAMGNGSTNLTFAIHRSSWNSLGVPNISAPAMSLITNPAVVNLSTNNTN